MSLRNPPRARPVDPRQPGGSSLEWERSAAGDLVPVLTVFLTNRECPWRCVYCDLWKHTLEREVAPGDIPAQMAVALGRHRAPGEAPRQVKLYNAGSFFDARAIPPADHPVIARQVSGFERVIVECHPALVGDRVARFRDELGRGRPSGDAMLEVAMGLETVNPDVLPRLNKGMTVDDFARAAEWLRREAIDVRAFVLVQPPFEAPGEAVLWARRSVEAALEAGAAVVSLIPVRAGNGALEALQAMGEFRPPTLDTFESAVDSALAAAAGRGRVFADLWDLELFGGCASCFAERRARLEAINRTQRPHPRTSCPTCG